MRLKKLVLNGFKSFADRTEFIFDSPITGIVGPNGCGKSNVVDAFKWVLGEQSAKSLRGDAMLDVIFNGSSVRKAAGMSEVILVFDNPRREDGTRHLNIDTDEVSVGRRLFRDATSEYQLNNASSRLKDVRELFLDTGVGVDAYSVIEQGKVAAMLEANPAERRLIFEEAAGISKFKAKKKEAQRKLEKVDQNLLRVHDIVDEVEKRLRSVKLQAGKARSYQEYTVRLSELRLQYALQEYHTHFGKLQELELKQTEAAATLEEIARELAQSQNGLAASRMEFDELSQQKQNAQHELVQARADLNTARQREQFAQQQLEQVAEQTHQFEQDLTTATARSAEVESSLEEQSQALERYTAELAEHRQLIDQRQQDHRDAQLRLNQTLAQIDSHKSAILDLMRRLAGIGSRLGAIEIERRNIATQQERLTARRAVVGDELARLEAARAQIEGRLDEVKLQFEAHQRSMDEKKSQAAALGQQIREISEQLGSAREHRSGLVSRQKLLQDLEAKREGVSEGVKSVLRQREQKFGFIDGLVADLLRVDVEHAHAIEAALDGRDQLLVARGLDEVLGAREAFEELEGRVNVICRTSIGPVEVIAGKDELQLAPEAESVGWAVRRPPIASSDREIGGQSTAHPTGSTTGNWQLTTGNSCVWNQHKHRIRLATDLVKAQPEDRAIAEHLLGKTVVVDDLATATDLYNDGPAGWRYVTRAGEVLEADGTFRAGPLTAAMGLLSRRSELEAIAFQVAEVDQRIAWLASQLSSGNAQAKDLEQAQNTLRTAIYQANETKVGLSSQLAQNNDKQSTLKREQPLLDQELDQYQDTIDRLASEEETLAAKRTELEADQSTRQQAVEELTAALRDLDTTLRGLVEEMTRLRIGLGQIEEKQISTRQAVQRLTSTRAELAQQIARIEQSAATLESRRAEAQDSLGQSQEKQEQLASRQAELSDILETLEQQVADAARAVQQLTGGVEKHREAHSDLEQDLHQVQMRVSELRVRVETLVQRTGDELQLDLPARYAQIAASEAGYQSGDVDWGDVATQIKDLREKVHRLGNVNLEAIGEQDELEKRAEFLVGQVTDLTESKRQLEELIGTINAESSIRFEQTFTAVRDHFQGMFRKLFGGGSADIFLETEVQEKQKREITRDDGTVAMVDELVTRKVDVLEAGIEILAKPPGKKPVSISQLSGGEKTMTCVALLMSIFKSKPSPFCILDEVDAALDEANNQRFNLIVQEFLEMSQFIIITHSKRTMQIADVLYGVTMQEQGVSKRVAVKFDQVDNQGRINEHAAA